MADKSVDQWVSEIEAEVAQEQVLEADLDQQTFMQELGDDRGLFGRMLEDIGKNLAHEAKSITTINENVQREATWAEINQKQQLLMNPTQGMERD